MIGWPRSRGQISTSTYASAAQTDQGKYRAQAQERHARRFGNDDQARDVHHARGGHRAVKGAGQQEVDVEDGRCHGDFELVGKEQFREGSYKIKPVAVIWVVDHQIRSAIDRRFAQRNW